MFYVTMTDRFTSGWGMADNRINKLVIMCDNFKDAANVKEYASRRSEMKYINIRTTAPSYPASTHYTQFEDKTNYATWFKG